MFQSPRCVVVTGLLVSLLVPSVAVACLWGYDTIKMERTRFWSTFCHSARR